MSEKYTRVGVQNKSLQFYYGLHSVLPCWYAPSFQLGTLFHNSNPTSKLFRSGLELTQYAVLTSSGNWKWSSGLLTH